jgi:4-hydroxyphenylpyruvate dioxygenase-like putative hemolysin
MTINAAFQWECQPKAETLILDILTSASQANVTIAKLAEQLLSHTNTRLFDWLDYVVAAESDQMLQNLREAGFVQQGNGRQHIFAHPGAQLPRVVLQPTQEIAVGIAVSVDSIADFLMVRGEKRVIEGSQFGNFRRSQLSLERESALWVIERRGTLTLQPTQEEAQQIYLYLQALEQWMNRPRALPDEDDAMHKTIQLAQQLIEEVGQHRAAWTVLEGERHYWQARNTAGQIQKNRQDRLGMGWANHDHHTFRSSRRHFNQLVHLFELLGFYCRERYYAGKEAGWGAQVMENPICRLVLFLDVDLAEDEIASDFAHEPLPDLDQLGTIGLWCALHGDSILKAGMHHLEAQFMFEELTHDLANQGIKMMHPFSDFPYLKQAFTMGENWPVDPNQVCLLVKQGKINSEQGKRFIDNGAIGSHLENLQRREGYKGFNQNNVSIIIRKTDPRLENDS